MVRADSPALSSRVAVVLRKMWLVMPCKAAPREAVFQVALGVGGVPSSALGCGEHRVIARCGTALA